MDRYSSPTAATADKVEALTDEAAVRADRALDSTRRVANDALDALSETVQDARRNAASTLTRAASRVDDLAHRGIGRARELSTDLRDRAGQARDVTVDYVRDEPVKSVLLAVAAGAALAVAVNLMTRSGRRDY